jgi:hypothetical protein
VRLQLAASLAISALATFASAEACRADPFLSGSLELSRPIGDAYDERTTDGDGYPQSLGVRALLARGDLAAWLDYRRNVYLTESSGLGSRTRYARIEGGYGTSVPFLARESSFEARVERHVGTRQLYAGLGGLRTWTNYHYPVLTGIGAGLELRAEPAAGVRAFGSAYYYPFATGRYETESLPNRMLTPGFGIVKLDGGFVVRSARSRVYGIVGYGFEQRSGRALPRDVRFIRSDPYVAIGLRS